MGRGGVTSFFDAFAREAVSSLNISSPRPSVSHFDRTVEVKRLRRFSVQRASHLNIGADRYLLVLEISRCTAHGVFLVKRRIWWDQFIEGDAKFTHTRFANPNFYP